MSGRLVPLRRLVELRTERAEAGAFKVGLENLESWTGRFAESESVFEGEGVAFRAGDVLFGKLRPYLAKAWVADRSGAAVGDFLVMRPRAGADAQFVRNVLLSPDSINRISASVYGSKMPRASWESVGALEITATSIEAQRASVAWVGRETAEIDAFIADQEQLVALLEERRRVTIANETRGGGAPSRTLGRVARVVNGGTPTPDAANWGGDIEWATPADMRVLNGDRTLRATSRAITRQGLSGGSSLSRPGSVLISSRAPVGYVAIVDRPVAFNQGCKSIEPGADVRVSFLAYQLEGMAEQMASASTGTTFQELSSTSLKALQVVIPALSDQEKVESRLSRLTGSTDAAIADARAAIALSKERRAALISAAVTGRIDVTDRKRVLV